MVSTHYTLLYIYILYTIYTSDPTCLLPLEIQGAHSNTALHFIYPQMNQHKNEINWIFYGRRTLICESAELSIVRNGSREVVSQQ